MDMAKLDPLWFEQARADSMRPAGARGPLVSTHTLAGGGVRNVEALVSPIVWNDRTVLFAIVHDVTDRKKTEEALAVSEDELRQTEERYRSLFDNMLDGVYRSTHEGRFVDVNPAMVKMFGFSSKEEMLQVDIKNELYFSAEERGSHILDTGQKQVEVYRMRRKDGSEIWVEDHGYYVHDEHGNIIYHEGLLRDVTERVRAEQAVRESENFLKQTQVIAGLGTYVLDFSTDMWKSSGVLDDIFGLDETYERSVEGWAALIHPQDRDEMIRYFTEEVVGGRRPFDREYKIVRHSDNTERWVHGKGVLEQDADGNLLRMKGTIQDITERRHMEDFLRHRLIELEALYNVSASLRTAPSFAEALPMLLDQTLQAIGTDTGAILIYDPNRTELKGMVSRGWFGAITDHPVKPGEGVAGTVFATGHPHISAEFAKDPLAHSRARNRIPAGWGGACLPIRAGVEMVGVLFVAVQLPRHITPQQLRLLHSLAEITGATLHRTRLFEETARRAEEFESLYEISKTLSAQTELPTLLEFIVDTAKNLLHASSSGMYLFDAASNELELIVNSAPYMTVGTRLKTGEGMAGRVALTRHSLRIEDYSRWEGRSPQHEGIPLRAVVEVPMLYGGELIGVLAVDEVGDSTRTFTENDERLLALFASQAAGGIHTARLRQEALQRLEHLQTLRVIDKAIASSFDLRITLNILLDHVVERLRVDAAAVLLLHPHDQTLQYAAGRGFRTRMIESADIRLNDGYAGRSVMERRVVEISSPSVIADNPPFASLWEQEQFTRYFCAPLIVKGEVKGVMEVYFRVVFKPTAEWFEFLETLASQAAITVDNAQLFDNLQRVNMEMAIAYETTMEGWARALDLRGRQAQGYTQRVADLTLTLAKLLGIKDSDLPHIRRGALLHDIGKMGVPDRILFKKGKLTEREQKEMRRHPEFAYQLLNPIRHLRPALDIPYCCHEKWDGTGYPRGLAGEQIPLAARIFAVADAWDALTHPQPGRKAWTKKKALSYLARQSGKQFDPAVVDALLQLMRDS